MYQPFKALKDKTGNSKRKRAELMTGKLRKVLILGRLKQKNLLLLTVELAIGKGCPKYAVRR